MILGSAISGKAGLMILLSDNLVSGGKLNAVNLIKDVAGEISGSGGGQPFLATAGGKNPEGISKAIAKAIEILKKI
jgi:alanyl-tRNA synthetase